MNLKFYKKIKAKLLRKIGVRPAKTMIINSDKTNNAIPIAPLAAVLILYEIRNLNPFNKYF